MPVARQATPPDAMPERAGQILVGPTPTMGAATQLTDVDDLHAMPSDPADAELVQLVVSHQAPIWRYLRLLGADPEEADDLMQETFVRVAARLRAGEELRTPAAFLRGVARNLLLGARRRDRRKPPVVSWLDAVDEFVAAEPEAIEDARVDALRACMERLQGRALQAVQWHHLDGVPREEVAVRLGIGINGVKSLLSRSRQMLRECVQRTERKERSS